MRAMIMLDLQAQLSAQRLSAVDELDLSAYILLGHTQHLAFAAPRFQKQYTALNRRYQTLGSVLCTGILLDLRREGVRLALVALGCISGIFCIASFLILCRLLPVFLRLLHVTANEGREV